MGTNSEEAQKDREVSGGGHQEGLLFIGSMEISPFAVDGLEACVKLRSRDRRVYDMSSLTNEFPLAEQRPREKRHGRTSLRAGPASDDSDTEVTLGGAVWRGGPGHASSMHSGKRISWINEDENMQKK